MRPRPHPPTSLQLLDGRHPCWSARSQGDNPRSDPPCAHNAGANHATWEPSLAHKGALSVDSGGTWGRKQVGL